MNNRYLPTATGTKAIFLALAMATGLPMANDSLGAESLAVGGLLQYDYSSYDGSFTAPTGESGSELFFREAFIEISAELEEDWELFIEYGVEQGELGELIMSYHGLGENTQLSFGLLSIPFGFDALADEAVMPMLERHAFNTVFIGQEGGAEGVMLSGGGDNFSYAFGLFEDDPAPNDNSLALQFAGRLTYLPLSGSGGSPLLHLGVGWLERGDAAQGVVQPGQTTTFLPDYRLEPAPEIGAAGATNLESAPLAFDGADSYSLEIAATVGALYFRSEYMKASYDGIADPDSARNRDFGGDFDGYSLLLAYTLTGETRQYDTAAGLFGGFDANDKGTGVWEIYARLSDIDLSRSHTDGSTAVTEGADARMITLGANWYAAEQFRIGLSYTDLENSNVATGEPTDGESLILRLQLRF